MASGAEAEAYERSLPRAQRRAGGVYYTPADVAARLVEDTLGALLAGGMAASAVRVIDPACGAGALLLAAYRRLLQAHAAERGPLDAAARRRVLETSIFGVDVDAQAVAAARAALLELAGGAAALDANVRVGDAIREVDARTFTVVLANPPYLDAETMTRHHAELRAHCQGRYAAASGNWDLYCVFVERCLQLCASGGRCGLIVPNKLASADYARAARGLLVREGRLVVVRDLQAAPVFAAGVYPIVVVVARGEAMRGAVVVERMTGSDTVGRREEVPAAAFGDPARPWPLQVGAARGVVAAIEAAGRPLGSIAEVRGAATVAEAYRIAGLIREGAAGLRILNSGTIDPYVVLWGQRRLRYLGASYLRPVIAEELLSELPPRRLAEARTPKVIVSGMTRALEAVVDGSGEYMAGKSTTIVSRAAIDLRALAAIINSATIGGYYRRVFGADRLAGGYLRIGPPQLRRLPIADPGPARTERLAGLVAAMTARPDPAVLRAIDEVVADCYGLTPADAALLGDL